MMCRALWIFVLITIIITESKQDVPSVECQRDTRLLFASDRFYSGIKYKCTFNCINSLDDWKSTTSSLPYSSQNILSISFNDSNLSELPDRILSSYSSVRTFDGSSLKLGTISSNTFSGTVSMDNINLSFNQLTFLLAKVFAGKKIKYLDLSNNLIAKIDDSAFSGSEIDKINLAFNKIKIMDFVNNMKFFNVLQMNNNEVEDIDKVNMKKNDWNGQRESFLGPVYPTIDLKNNNLKTFNCKSSLKFTLIELKDNPDLKSLDLGECQITQLDVSDCGSLKSFKLNENIYGLTAKNVTFDQIDFRHSQSLEILKLVNNSLSPEMFNDIMRLENLTSLDLSYNQIGELNISTFSKLKKLSSLGLKSTKISNIQFGTFSHQNGVRMLDISDNNLGNFDMQMIFSMTSLTHLDLSGNDLIELSNIEAAHNTFALLEKIDLTNNKWTCSYLLRLIKIMRAYRVALVHSYIEEHQSNINGIKCRHVAGEDDVVEPLSPNTSNITDVRDKMNEVVSQLTKETQLRSDMLVRLSTLENRVNNQQASSQLLRSDNASEIPQNIQVKNSVLFEMTLIIVFCFFIVFMSLKIVVYVKRNFLNHSRPMRVGLSENTLTMNVDDY